MLGQLIWQMTDNFFSPTFLREEKFSVTFFFVTQNMGKENLAIERKLIREGRNDRRPRKGQKIRVHYTGRLTTGQKFDGSRDKGNVKINFK